MSKKSGFGWGNGDPKIIFEIENTFFGSGKLKSTLKIFGILGSLIFFFIKLIYYMYALPVYFCILLYRLYVLIASIYRKYKNNSR